MHFMLLDFIYFNVICIYIAQFYIHVFHYMHLRCVILYILIYTIKQFMWMKTFRTMVQYQAYNFFESCANKRYVHKCLHAVSYLNGHRHWLGCHSPQCCSWCWADLWEPLTAQALLKVSCRKQE